MGCGQETRKNYYGELINIIKHDEITYSFDFNSDDIKSWNEGDSSMLIVSVNDTLVGKQFSYASLQEDKYIRFTTRISEACSDYKNVLSGLAKGEYVKISEPTGNFGLKRENRPVVLLSNGVGISAVRSLVKSFVNNQDLIPKMIQFNVDARSNIYKEEFDLYRSEVSQFQSYYLSNRKTYYSMLNHELRILLKNDSMVPYIYIVGSESFVSENVMYLLDLGLTGNDLIVDDATGCCHS